MSVTRHRFEEAERSLGEKIARMGTAVEEMLRDAVASLVQGDIQLATEIVVRDEAVNQLDREIEMDCLRLLSLQQPVASDLRFISAALKVIADIERIGDHSVSIAKVALRLDGENSKYAPLVDIPQLAERVKEQMRGAFAAFVHGDKEAASRVIEGDKERVDALYKQMRRDLRAVMEQVPASVVLASHLLFVTHYLERIGDHAVGIAERADHNFRPTDAVREQVTGNRG